MSKHTPGPWLVDPQKINGSSFRNYNIRPVMNGRMTGHCIAHVGHRPPNSCDPIDYAANSRLIAKAPELLALVRDYLAEHDRDAVQEVGRGCRCYRCAEARRLIAEIEG